MICVGPLPLPTSTAIPSPSPSLRLPRSKPHRAVFPPRAVSSEESPSDGWWPPQQAEGWCSKRRHPWPRLRSTSSRYLVGSGLQAHRSLGCASQSYVHDDDDEIVGAGKARLGTAWVAPYIHPSFRARTRWRLYFFFFAPLRALELACPRT